jgi:hypothetical protein
MAMEALAACAVDVCLAGHLHVSHLGRAANRYSLPGRDVLLVQAGTAASTRDRGDGNAFNVLTVDGPAVQVERRTWDRTARAFATQAVDRYRRVRGAWHPA